MTKYKPTKEIKLNACPRCGETAPEMHYVGAYQKWRVTCPKCGLSARFYKRLCYAVHDWNERINAAWEELRKTPKEGMTDGTN